MSLALSNRVYLVYKTNKYKERSLVDKEDDPDAHLLPAAVRSHAKGGDARRVTRSIEERNKTTPNALKERIMII